MPKREPAPADRRYLAHRNEKVGGASVVVIDPSTPGAGRRLDPRFDLREHSPDGFQWGYGGSGPAQLALALVADATGDDELAQRTYQRFKGNTIARVTGDTWEMTAAEVVAEVASYEDVVA